MHTDAVQAFGKVTIDAATQQFDLLSISGHKFGAPKGIGALFIRRGTPLQPLMHGGTQDRGSRPGTENVASAIGLARAAELAVEEHERRMRGVSSRCATGSRQRSSSECPTRSCTGAAPARSSRPQRFRSGTDSESLLMALDLKGIAALGWIGLSERKHHAFACAARRSESRRTSPAPRFSMSLGSLTTDECDRPRHRSFSRARDKGAAAQRRSELTQ